MPSLQHRLERCRPSAVSIWASLPVTRVTLAMPVRGAVLAPVRWSKKALFQTFKKCRPGAIGGAICRRRSRRASGAMSGALQKRHFRRYTRRYLRQASATIQVPFTRHRRRPWKRHSGAVHSGWRSSVRLYLLVMLVAGGHP